MTTIDYHLLTVPGGEIDLSNPSHVNSAIAHAYDELKHVRKYAHFDDDLRTSVRIMALSGMIGVLLHIAGCDEDEWWSNYKGQTQESPPESTSGQ